MHIDANKPAKLTYQEPGICQTLPQRRIAAAKSNPQVHVSWMTDLVRAWTPFTEGRFQKVGRRHLGQTIRRFDFGHRLVNRPGSKLTLASGIGHSVASGDALCAFNSLSAALP